MQVSESLQSQVMSSPSTVQVEKNSVSSQSFIVREIRQSNKNNGDHSYPTFAMASHNWSFKNIVFFSSHTE